MRSSVLLLSLMMACTPAAPDRPGTTGDGTGDGVTDTNDDYAGPGTQDWADADLSCEVDDDCYSGEACVDNRCRIETCNGPQLDSLPPAGTLTRFVQEAEFALGASELWNNRYPIDVFGPNSTGANYMVSEEVTARVITDLAGGNFFGWREESFAAASQGLRVVHFSATEETIDPGLVPAALAAGDFDLDGVDELVAASADGDFVICTIAAADCELWPFDGGNADVVLVDAAAGDLDGDLLPEVALLVDLDGVRNLYVRNIDDTDGQNADYWADAEMVPDDGWFGDGVLAVEIGDLDGDEVGEVLALVDYDTTDLFDDEIYTFVAVDSGSGVTGSLVQIGTYNVHDAGDATDLAVTDLDGDDSADLLVLEGGAEVNSYTFDAANTELFLENTTNVAISADPQRIAAADFDGDAPMSELNGETTCEGRIVPVMALVVPPYDRQYSDGVASASYGDSESTSETFSDSVSLGLNVDVGIGGDLFGAFGGSIGTRISRNVWSTSSVRTNFSVGGRYSIRADPATHGPNYGAVVVSYGCFDAYKYMYDDPAGLLEAALHGEEYVMTVPTGGGVVLLSSHRYNAMAEELGLPIIDFPYTVGDVDSYPTSPETLHGEPLAPGDLVIPAERAFSVSDIGSTSWRITMGETSTDSTTTSYGFGLSADIKAFGVKVGGGVQSGWGDGYSVGIGTSAFFGGGLPPIPDNPNTPEDEYDLHKYSVLPYVYQQLWADEEGEVGAFYVMNYAVER